MLYALHEMACAVALGMSFYPPFFILGPLACLPLLVH